jgi:16S rRNA (cytidine1402-2'-O)-methyltransferase
MAGVLYLVATPIGNLADITLRALETLKAVDVIACEDTRHTGMLLHHYGIKRPLISFHDHSERRRTPELIEKIKAGENAALVSDAGTPGIADPGFRLVRDAIAAGIRVEALPGPSALLYALVVSGFPTDRFVFEGFVPVKSGQRLKAFAALKGEERTVIFYESPHRLLKSLAAAREALGDVRVVVARELTKKFEEVFRGRLSEAEARFTSGRVLGEFVLLFNLKDEADEGSAL